MKKLIIGTAFVLAAVASQAATALTWGALNVKTPIASDPKQSQTGIVGSGAALSDFAINVFWIDSYGADQFVGTFNTGKDTNAGKVAAQQLGGSDSALYTAMLEDQGSAWKPQYHVTATYSTTDGVYTYSGVATASKALADIKSYSVAATMNFTNGTWNYTANAVPEPTSGLMLLLGVAGLALRRRRA